MNRKLHRLRFILLALVGVICLSACSKLPGENEVTKKGEAASEWVQSLYQADEIGEEARNAILSNIYTYDHKGFFASYWPFAAALVIWWIWLGLVGDWADPDPDRTRPVAKEYLYKKWLLSLPFGMALCPLAGGTREDLKDENDSKGYGVQGWISAIIMLGVPIVALCNWRDINYYWTEPSLFFCDAGWGISKVLVTLYLVYNLIVIPALIPSMCRRYNANWFRRNYENEDILAGKPTRVEIHVAAMQQLKEEVDADVQTINTELAKGTDYESDLGGDLFDRMGRGFNDFVTGGKYSLMERERRELEVIDTCYKHLKGRVNELEKIRTAMLIDLNRMRKAADRNIYLYKEILGFLPQSVNSQSQGTQVDRVATLNSVGMNVGQAANVNMETQQLLARVDQEVGAIVAGVMALSLDVFNGAMKDSESKGKLLEASVGLAIAAITSIFTMNGEVSEQRVRIQHAKKQLTEAIAKMEELIPEYQASMARVAEVISSLDACNKTFVRLYTPLNKLVFEADSEELTEQFKKLQTYAAQASPGREASVAYDKFVEDMNALRAACSAYNKINKETTIQEV